MWRSSQSHQLPDSHVSGKNRVCQYHGDAFGELFQRKAGNELLIELDATLPGLDLSQNGPDQGGFSDAVWTKQASEFARKKGKIQVGENLLFDFLMNVSERKSCAG
jgi:hypothetical protein